MPAELLSQKPVPERRRRPVHPGTATHPALEHPRRRRILEALRDQPSLSFRGIVRATDIPAGTARHHLNMLLRAELVWEHRLGSRFMHFPGRRPMSRGRVPEAVAGGLDENPRRVLELVRGLAPRHQPPILEAADAIIGLSRSTTQHTLQRLEDYGLLSTRRQGRCVVYEVVD